MNQLKDWGFSSEWWRGDRGEYWVIAQFLLFFGFILLPVYPAITVDTLAPLWQYGRWISLVVFGVIGVLLSGLGVTNLGHNLTPLPHPKDESALVTSGVYRFVRHPIYSGVIFLAISYSIWQLSLIHAIGSIVFLIFFDVKARKEEAWLKEKFADYATYQNQVKKLIPWIY
ncbi:MAG: isoprenylcysteine carboxylmethyltransferase family protein [Snowella sp.]|nr:isoprenylcysteine carboxylmethyltransferase family protein [Snowella sp.]